MIKMIEIYFSNFMFLSQILKYILIDKKSILKNPHQIQITSTFASSEIKSPHFSE